MFIANLISSILKQTFHEYINIECNVDDYTLGTQRGDLISIMKVHGVNDIMSQQDMRSSLEVFGDELRPFLQNPSHQLSIVFSSDPDNAKRQIERMLHPARQSCRAIGLDDSILIDSQINRIVPLASEENCYIVFYTDYAALSQIELKIHQKRIAETSKGKPLFPNGQSLFLETRAIYHQHKSFVDSISSTLSSISVHAEVLNCHDCVREIRTNIEANLVDDQWNPMMVGDKIGLRVDNNNDVASVPRISEQVLTSKPFVNNQDVYIGGRYYRPFLLTIAPRDIKMFHELFARIPYGLPWRMCIHLESNVMMASGLKILFSNLTSWMMDSNKRIRDGWRWLQDIQAKDIDGIVGLRMSIVTWANDMDELEVRFAKAVRAIEGWGESKVTADSNDPFESFLSTVPALSKDLLKSSMPCAPLYDLMPMMPLFRPSMPWGYGGMLFTSFDGKPLPMEAGSSIQANWNALFFAPPGSGKSVAMLNLVLAVIMAGGNKQLPKIGIIDIGPSSKGLINMLKFLLPDNLKHLVGRYRMQFTPKYSVNPCDLFLGGNYPLSLDREFLVMFTSILCTPSGKRDVYPNTSEVLSMAIDAAYRDKAEEGANPFRTGVNQEIDDAIESHSIKTDQYTTWYEMSDLLFDTGLIEHAKSAMRYAVPLLGDIARMIIQDQGIRDMYCDDKIASEGVKLLKALSRNLTNAIADFGIFSQPTVFNVDAMRIVSLDLDEVAKARGKKSSVMYMLARHVLVKTYYFDKDHISSFPEKYHDFYDNFCIENKGSIKGLFMDEYHRTKPISGDEYASRAVRAQTVVDKREGRKFNVMVVLASQDFNDFNDEILTKTTTRYILGYGSHDEVNEISRTLGLNDEAKRVLLRHISAPNKHGANMLINYKTKETYHTQAVRLVCPSQRLWFLSTTSEDGIILERMFNVFPQKDVLDYLAEKFPSGSAKHEIEQRLRNQNGDSFEATEGEAKAAALEFVNQLIHNIQLHGFHDV